MRIDENKVFVFSFDTSDMGSITFPMRGNSREEAADALQKTLGRIQTEIAMEFPKVSSAPATGVQDVATNAIPSEVIELRIDTILKDMGYEGITDAQKAEAIKNWTDLDYTASNFPEIVNRLQGIATGQIEVKPKPRGKAK